MQLSCLTWHSTGQIAYYHKCQYSDSYSNDFHRYQDGKRTFLLISSAISLDDNLVSAQTNAVKYISGNFIAVPIKYFPSTMIIQHVLKQKTFCVNYFNTSNNPRPTVSVCSLYSRVYLVSPVPSFSSLLSCKIPTLWEK